MLLGRTTHHPAKYRHLVGPGMLLHKGGTTVGAVALCGYTWVPTDADNTKPTCGDCARLARRAAIRDSRPKPCA